MELARYTLLLPGALLSAVGLWRQRAELSAAGDGGDPPYAAAAAAVLAVYAIAGGAIVAPGPLTPGGILDSEGWFDLTGLPLEVVRAVAGLALCVLAVKLLEIFDVEAKQQLESLDRARAIAEERSRFRRDLHDGTIQSIYAAALHLESVAIRCDEPSTRSEVREVVADLNAVTDGIRDYIRALAQTPATPEGIAAGLGALTRRFAEETGGDVRFRAEGLGAAGPLPEEAGEHLEQILREALSNTARHAGPAACRCSWRSTPTSSTSRSPTTAAGAAPAPRRPTRSTTRDCATCASARAGSEGALRSGPGPRGGTRVMLSRCRSTAKSRQASPPFPSRSRR